jgi:hypothetical protein
MDSVSKGVLMDYMGQQLAMQPQGGMMPSSSNAPDIGSRTAPLGSAPASLEGDQMKQLLIKMAQALALLQQKQADIEQRLGGQTPQATPQPSPQAPAMPAQAPQGMPQGM